jgi:arsenate reductase
MTSHRASGKQTVLFVCVHNAGRSQMTVGFVQHRAAGFEVVGAWPGLRARGTTARGPRR